MISTSDFSEFVIHRSEELHFEVFGGLKNLVRRGVVGGAMAFQAANAFNSGIPPQHNLNLPTPSGQEHNDAIEREEQEKRKLQNKSKSKKVSGVNSGGNTNLLNLPSLPVG